jgi:hypothetical protein
MLVIKASNRRPIRERARIGIVKNDFVILVTKRLDRSFAIMMTDAQLDCVASDDPRRGERNRLALSSPPINGVCKGLY